MIEGNIRDIIFKSKLNEKYLALSPTSLVELLYGLKNSILGKVLSEYRDSEDGKVFTEDFRRKGHEETTTIPVSKETLERDFEIFGVEGLGRTPEIKFVYPY